MIERKSNPGRISGRLHQFPLVWLHYYVAIVTVRARPEPPRTHPCVRSTNKRKRASGRPWATEPRRPSPWRRPLGPFPTIRPRNATRRRRVRERRRRGQLACVELLAARGRLAAGAVVAGEPMARIGFLGRWFAGRGWGALVRGRGHLPAAGGPRVAAGLERCLPAGSL